MKNKQFSSFIFKKHFHTNYSVTTKPRKTFPKAISAEILIIVIFNASFSHVIAMLYKAPLLQVQLFKYLSIFHFRHSQTHRIRFQAQFFYMHIV